MKIGLRIFWGLLFATLIGCGSGPDGEGNPITLTTPEGAVNSLSKKHREAFEDWKARLVKSCDGSDAFGTDSGSGSLGLGLDLPYLLERNSRSLVVAEGDEVALLGAPRAFAGFSTSKIEETEEINGKTYKLQAELKREGLRCTVILYGQKVHEVDIAEQVDVIGYWSSEKNPKVKYRKTSRTQFGHYSELKNHGVIEAITDMDTPNEKAFRILGSRFGISIDKIPSLFRMTPSAVSARASVLLSGETSTAWISGEYPRLLLSTDTARRLLETTPQTVEVEWRVGIPQTGYGDGRNDADLGALRFTSTLEISKKQDSEEFGFLVTQLKFLGVKGFESGEASQCVSTRARLFKLVDAEPLGLQVHPSLSEAINPCRPLTADIDKQIFLDGTIKSLIAGILRGISAAHHTRYQGWEDALSRLSLEYLEKGIDIGKELNPQGSIPIIQELSKYTTLLKRELQKSSHLNPVKEVVYQMGIDWALTGQAVSSAKIERILAAADNSFIPFKVSTEKLLKELSRDASTQDTALSFALNIDSSYRAEALRALALAKALDYQEWELAYFDQVLQRQIPVGELIRWHERLGRIQFELAKYPVVQKIRGSLTRLTNKWLLNGEVTLEEVGKVYASLSNSYDPFEVSTQKLLGELGQSLGRNKEALNFAYTLTAEYKQVAVSIREKAFGIGFEDWSKSFFSGILQNRPSFGQLVKWEATLLGAREFSQREHVRMQGESDFINEGYRKDIIRIALKESWEAEDFSQMEHIAGLGRFKLTCDRYKGVSSIVNCTGMSSYSKAPKKFFDPAFKSRYWLLAKDCVSYMGELQPENEYYSLRSALVSGFFGSFDLMWASCTDGAYEAKAAALRTQIPAYVKEKDLFKKWDKERSIRKTLENCN